MGDARTHFRTCPLCEAGCGVRVEADHETRKLLSVRGDPDDPFSRGYICPKAVSLKELSEDPDIVRTPMIKRGGVFHPATWAEALDLTAERLNAVKTARGANAIGAYYGNPSGHHPGLMLAVGLIGQALGTRQAFSSTSVDHAPKILASALMFGDTSAIVVPDIDHTDFLVVQGANPMVSNGSLMVAPGMNRRLEALRARGGRLVVIDPRRTETAAIADLHIPLKPGTDALFLFAIIHELFEAGRVDLGRLAAFSKGLDTIRALATDFPPDRVARACGVPAETIRQLAVDFADANSAVWYGRMGSCTQRFGSLTCWLQDVITILTGNLDRRGGGMFHVGALPPVPAGAKFSNGIAPFGRWGSRVEGLPELAGLLPTAALIDEIVTPGEGQIRAFVTVAGNPVLSTPNGQRLADALDGLDFMVSFDIYLNETTRHADVILPSPTWERHSDGHFYFSTWMVRKTAKSAPAVFALEEDQRDDWDAAIGLAARLKGISEAEAEANAISSWLRRAIAKGAHPRCREIDFERARAMLGGLSGPDQVYDILIRTHAFGDAFGLDPAGLTLHKVRQSPHGVDLGALTSELPGRLATPDGMIDLAPKLLVADVERLRAALPDMDSRRELLLVGRRHTRSKNSWMHNLHVLAKGKDRCTLMMHPSDAAARNLNDGALARVSTDTGSIEIPVELTDGVMPGVVCAPHGFGHDLDGARLRIAERRPGVNINRLIDDKMFDAPSINAVVNGVPVQVRAA